MAPYSSSVIVAQPKVHELLKKLHELSESQETSISQRWFYFSRLIKFFLFGQTWSSSADVHMEDKLVALDVDKCQFMYIFARSLGIRNAIEAGTSNGVSTIYLALAVGQNVEQLRRSSGDNTITGKVIGTEKEAAKAVKARENWKAAGSEVEPWIELREGNLLETLKESKGMPETIDLLLLDSMFSSNPSYMHFLWIESNIL